jgi:hypothetical protein
MTEIKKTLVAFSYLSYPKYTVAELSCYSSSNVEY